uniref:Uncharacterized protein n=1 Tax=Brassica campestris TaxID=3711 RepID=M4E1B6_BRACM
MCKRVRNNNETGLNQFLPLSLSLKRILDMEMRMTGLETTTDAVKVDLLALKADFKEEITATRSTFNMILQALHSQVSLHAASVTPTTQPQAQPGTTTQQYDFERLPVVYRKQLKEFPSVEIGGWFSVKQHVSSAVRVLTRGSSPVNRKLRLESHGGGLEEVFAVLDASLIHQTRFLGLNLHVGCSVDRPLHQFAFVIAGDPSCLSLVLVEKSGSDACSGAFIDRWAIGHLV